MRWRTAIVALGLGMVGGAGLMLWQQREEIRTFVTATTPHPLNGNIPLLVEQNDGVMRLRWSPKVVGIRDAARGSLTITDGAHESRLELDGRELRAGLASYWPDGARVGFRLETDAGASGYIEAPVEAVPAKPAEPTATEEPKSDPAKRAAPARRRPKSTAGNSPGKPIDDGLEWTQQPARRASHWARFRRKMAFWRKPASEAGMPR